MREILTKKLAALIAANPVHNQQYLVALTGIGEQGREFLHYYRAPRLARELERARTISAPQPVPSLPEGARLLLFKHPLPGETQARLAYEYVLAEFVRYIEQSSRAVAENESAGHVLLWFPLEAPSDPRVWLGERWRAFLEELTSAKGFRQTFALALNSAKLAGGAGFSTLETPIFSHPHALSIAGLYWLAMQKGLAVNRRDLEEADELLTKASEEPDAKKARELREKEAEKRKKALAFQEQVRTGFERLIKQSPGSRTSQTIGAVLREGDLQTLPTRLKAHNPQLYRQVEYAARGYGATAQEQLNSARGDIFPRIVWEMVRLAEGEYELYPLPPLLSAAPFASGLRPAGDAHGRFCYSCGKALAKTDPRFKSRRLLFEAPEQRAQSAGSGGPVDVCAVCAGLSLLGPVKLTGETQVVRLDGRGEVREEAQRALERQVLNELGASAGDYIALRATESDKNGKPAPTVWGRKQYAIAKLALTLPPEVFRWGLEAYIYDKGREVRLRPSTLFATAALGRAYRQEIRLGNDLNRRLGRAIRHFDQGKWVFGEYELLLGLTEAGFDANELPTIGREAEESRGSLLEVLMEEGGQAVREAQKQRHIVGYASLLHAFTEETRRALRDRKDFDQEAKDRELKKLVQLADAEPTLFLNRTAAARTTPEGAEGYGYDEVRLYWDERHQYGYRWAKELLEAVDKESGQNLQREGNAEIEGRPARFLSLRPEDLAAVYGWLRTQYPSPADWRSFLYQTKLFLFTRYPRLLQN
ncbi:MAG: hypothetical protein KatS3mg071_1983 [Meiothermus sp.]|nr:MAG: hypothetical protein KatS3mg071_1983 [Meiothermus sp.]